MKEILNLNLFFVNLHYFNFPTRKKNTLDKIQKYLNRKMEIGNSVNNNNNKTEINNNNKTEINNENKNKICSRFNK